MVGWGCLHVLHGADWAGGITRGRSNRLSKVERVVAERGLGSERVLNVLKETTV